MDLCLIEQRMMMMISKKGDSNRIPRNSGVLGAAARSETGYPIIGFLMRIPSYLIMMRIPYNLIYDEDAL